MPIALFWLLVSLLYAATFQTIELSLMPHSGFSGFIMVTVKWLALAFCSSGVLGLMCINRIVFAVTFPVLTAISSTVCYFLVSIGSGITPVTIELAEANSLSMWMTLVSPLLVCVFVLSLAASVVIVWYRWTHVKSSKKTNLILAAICIVIITVPACISSRLRQAVEYRLPYSLYTSVKGYLDNRKAVAKLRTTFDNTPVSAAASVPDIYVILGESLRADHLPFNGYARNTMPHLSGDSAIVSFPQVYSNVSYTHASVPRIMTDADSVAPQRAYTEQSFITLFKKAGYRTSWLANQDFSDSYAYFAHEADSLILCNAVMSAYNPSRYTDMEILPHFRRWVNSTNGSRRLAVIHTIGSHWGYKSHYPERRDNFLPDMDNHDIALLSHEQIINSYDNTILETDRFVSGLIDMIRSDNAMVIFISDHGENLGENGKYLHSEDSEEARHPACFVWYSEKYAARFPDKVSALKRNRLNRYTTDAIFHTVLDAAGLDTPALKHELSMFYDTAAH